jgi:PAS domain S-box-containing protein
MHDEGIVRYANTAAVELYGATSLDEMLGRHIIEFNTLTTPEAFEARMSRIRSGEVISGERILVQRRDGTIRIVDWSARSAVEGDGSTVLLYLQDVTPRAEAEAALEHSERRFRMILESSPIGLALVDTVGRYLQVNKALADIVGRTIDELRGMRFIDMLHPDDARDEEAALQRLLSSDLDIYSRERRYLHASGVPVWVSVDAALVRDADGRPEYFVVQVRDLTGPKAAEGEQAEHLLQLSALNEELRHANELKDHFVAVTSHEIRSPLTAIIGYASTLRRMGDRLDPERREQALVTIERQGRRLGQLVEDLLTLATADAGRLSILPQDVSLRPSVELAVEDLNIDEVSIAVDCPDGLTLRVDPMRLTQMLVNYLSNAVKYGAAPITVSCLAIGDDVEIRVCDSGAGIPDELSERLFERFARAEGATKLGTGLGLAIVRTLAEAHGGQAWYEPGKPSGACFALRLPRVT